MRLIGSATEIHITAEEDHFLATCLRLGDHRNCTWSEMYDSRDDATEYADDHADGLDVKYGRWKLS